MTDCTKIGNLENFYMLLCLTPLGSTLWKHERYRHPKGVKYISQRSSNGVQ